MKQLTVEACAYSHLKLFVPNTPVGPTSVHKTILIGLVRDKFRRQLVDSFQHVIRYVRSREAKLVAYGNCIRTKILLRLSSALTTFRNHRNSELIVEPKLP